MNPREVGGSAKFQFVAYHTEKYVAGARIDDTGEIRCSLERRSSTSRWLESRLKQTPTPYVVRDILLRVTETSARSGFSWAIALLTVEAIVLAIGLDPLTPIHFLNSHRVIPWLYGFFFLRLLLSFAISWDREAMAYHAAEHMVHDAYAQTGSTRLANIIEASRIHSRCGITGLVPYEVFKFGSLVIAAHLSVSPILALLAGVEIANWIDRIWGWHHVPITSTISRFLQEKVFTAPPDETELLVAKTAFDQLLLAHGEELVA